MAARPYSQRSAHAGASDIEAPLVDAHAHIFPRDVPLTARAWSRPDYGFTAEDYLGAMDASGVHFGVIAAMSITGDYNDYVVDAVATNRRLRGTVYVPPSIPRGELREMAEAGIVGLRLFRSARSFVEVDDITTDEYRILFRRARDLDWHVHIAVDADLLDETLTVLNASGVKIVVDHFGNPDRDLLERAPQIAPILRSVEKGRTWVKISAGYRLAEAASHRTPSDYAAARERERRLDAYFVNEVGADRLLWGSDAPFIGHEESVTYQDTVDAYVQAVPAAETRREIDRTGLDLYFG